MAEQYRTLTNLREVCELFDLQVLRDAVDDDGENFRGVYALGQPSELAAGLRGFQVTPYFDTLDLLDNFCGKHIGRFRELSKGDEPEIPDATTWAAEGR